MPLRHAGLIEYEGSADIDASLLEALIRIAREVEVGVIALGRLSL